MRMSWKFPACASDQSEDFPFLVFHVEREGEIDVWRVLHGARDIPAWMQPPPEE